jgi:hypothetical protein
MSLNIDSDSVAGESTCGLIGDMAVPLCYVGDASETLLFGVLVLVCCDIFQPVKL